MVSQSPFIVWPENDVQVYHHNLDKYSWFAQCIWAPPLTEALC